MSQVTFSTSIAPDQEEKAKLCQAAHLTLTWMWTLHRMWTSVGTIGFFWPIQSPTTWCSPYMIGQGHLWVQPDAQGRYLDSPHISTEAGKGGHLPSPRHATDIIKLARGCTQGGLHPCARHTGCVTISDFPLGPQFLGLSEAIVRTWGEVREAVHKKHL